MEARIKEHQRNQMSGMDGLDYEHYVPPPGLDLVKGVLSDVVPLGKKQGTTLQQSLTSGVHIFYAEPLPKTVELFDHFDIDTPDKMLREIGTVLVRNKTSWKVVDVSRRLEW